MLQSEKRTDEIQDPVPSTSTAQSSIHSEESQWLSSWESLDEFKHDHDALILHENARKSDDSGDESSLNQNPSKPFSKPKGRPQGKKNKNSFGRKNPKAEKMKLSR